MSDMLSINVSEHIEKKGNLSYLSWAWAWAEVLKIDPDASWRGLQLGPEPSPAFFFPDGSAMVGVAVKIKGNEKLCTLPVMDNRNNAVKNPDARKISDAIMRCLAKAIAMHGLGLYIYAGEDLPMVSSPEDEAREKRGAELDELAMYLVDCHKSEKDLDAIRVWYDPKTWAEDSDERNQEQLYVWGLLKTQSKLRSTIKANKPTGPASAGDVRMRSNPQPV